MKRITVGDGSAFIYDKNNVSYELKNANVTGQELEKIESLPGIGFRFRSDFEENQLLMHFDREDDFMIYDRVRIELAPSYLQRLIIAQNLLSIAEYFEQNEHLVTLFHPLNFFVHKKEGTVLVLYRGLKGQMPAPGYLEESISEQVKRLLLLLFSTSRYEELLLNGNAHAKYQVLEGYRGIVKWILKAKSVVEMKNFIQCEIMISICQSLQAESEETPNPKLLERIGIFGKQKVVLIGGIAVSLLVVLSLIFSMI